MLKELVAFLRSRRGMTSVTISLVGVLVLEFIFKASLGAVALVGAAPFVLGVLCLVPCLLPLYFFRRKE